MKKFDIVRQAKIINIAVAALILITGILILTIPEFQGVYWLKVTLGILCITIGFAKMLGYFSNDLYRLAFQFDFAIGIFVTVMGILILAGPEEKITEQLALFIGIYVMLEGLIKVQIALDARRFGMSKWLIILISAIVTCLIGILTLVATVTTLPQDIIRAVALIAEGVEDCWVTAYTVRVRARKKSFDNKYGLEDNK